MVEAEVEAEMVERVDKVERVVEVKIRVLNTKC